MELVECAEWLGPAGYGYAQVSPPQEHIAGAQWWTDYQPVSHEIQSKRGTRAQFAAMVATCNDAGIGIIVDAVLNLTGLTSGSATGVAGDVYTHYSYPAVPYTSDNFHAACVWDGSNATSIRYCQLDSLADLATETAAVQALESAYLEDLMSLGVSGFRFNTAMSMQVSDIAAFLAPLTTKPYVVQEVWSDSTSPVPPNIYVSNGDVLGFSATEAMNTAFFGGGLSALLDWPESGWVASSNMSIFVADHDTERTNGWLNATSANNAYTLATIFLLAQSYGSPTILSGYTWTYYDEGAPLDSNNNALNTTCYSDGWRCEQRWTAITNMVGFHNAASGTSQRNVVATSASQISFGRGSVGHVAINYESSNWTVTLSTDVLDGSYCEIIHDTDTSFTTCSSSTIVVSGGSFTVTVPAYDAIAFYAIPSLVSVTFSETATTSVGQTVVLVGSVSELGTWVPASGVSLTDTSSYVATGVWEVTVSLPASTTIDYKFVITDANGTVASWESDPNRNLTTPASGSVTVTDTWM